MNYVLVIDSILIQMDIISNPLDLLLAGSSDTVFFTDVPNKDANGNLDGSGKGTLLLLEKRIQINCRLF